MRPDQFDHGRADLGRGDLVTVGEAAVQDQAPDPLRGVAPRRPATTGAPMESPSRSTRSSSRWSVTACEHLQVGVERLGPRPRVGEPAARLVVGHHGPAGGDRGEEGPHGRVLPRDLQVTDPGRRHDQGGTPTRCRRRPPARPLAVAQKRTCGVGTGSRSRLGDGWPMGPPEVSGLAGPDDALK